MTQIAKLRHEFLEAIPDSLAEGTLYISIAYATAIHKCCCGCGNEVVTPLSPTDWKLIFDGETVSLDPSIGNWSFDCQSHYWIDSNIVHWAPRWSKKRIEAGRERDRIAKNRYFESRRVVLSESTSVDSDASPDGFWSKLRKLWF